MLAKLGLSSDINPSNHPSSAAGDGSTLARAAQEVPRPEAQAQYHGGKQNEQQQYLANQPPELFAGRGQHLIADAGGVECNRLALLSSTATSAFFAFGLDVTQSAQHAHCERP